MAVYVAVEGDIQRLRHLDLSCAGGGEKLRYLGRMSHHGHRPALAPTWRAGAAVIAYVSNGKAVQAATARCGKCFDTGGPLPATRRWHDAERHVSKLPSTGVYELYDPERRISQIGSGSLPSRVRRRIAATEQSRFGAADCIWWLYDLLAAGGQPRLRSLKVDAGESARAAEERWREARRKGGWQVSSDV